MHHMLFDLYELEVLAVGLRTASMVYKEMAGSNAQLALALTLQSKAMGRLAQRIEDYCERPGEGLCDV